MLLLRAKSGPPKTTVKGNTVTVDRHISGNLEETRAMKSRRIHGKQPPKDVNRRLNRNTPMMRTPEVQQMIDYLEEKHNKKF